MDNLFHRVSVISFIKFIRNRRCGSFNFMRFTLFFSKRIIHNIITSSFRQKACSRTMKSRIGGSIKLVTASLLLSVAAAFIPQTQEYRRHKIMKHAECSSGLVSPLLSRPLSLLSASGSTEASESSLKEIDLLVEADKIFNYIDKNSDGVICLEELQDHLVGEMGYSDEYTEYLFASIDTDSDGQITKEEMRFAFYNFEALSMYMTLGLGGSDITKRKAFKQLARKNSSTSPEARDKLLLDDLADLIFDIIDKDSSGEISKSELKKHFDNVTSKHGVTSKGSAKQSSDYVSTMFATLDVNEDGDISRKEIRAAFAKYDFKLLASTFGMRLSY